MDTQEQTPVVEEEEKSEEEKAVEKQIKDLADALAIFPGAPTRETIEGWKREFGGAYASGTTDTEIFIWRSVTRGEFTEISVNAVEQQLTQLGVEEALVKKCLLWASPGGQEALVKKGGTITLLHEQIMVHSNFLDPRVASQIVIKL